MTNEEIMARQLEARQWAATSAGAAFHAFEYLHHHAVVLDSKDNPSYNHLTRVWDKSNEARQRLIDEIKRLQIAAGEVSA